jgi:hypothetical protein
MGAVKITLRNNNEVTVKTIVYFSLLVQGF